MNPEISKAIECRIREFEKLGELGYTIFNFRPFVNLSLHATIKSELAFCISTANSSAKSGLLFQKKLESTKIEKLSMDELSKLLKSSGVRFYNQKAKYIADAIKNFEFIQEVLTYDSYKARKELTKNIKGLGLKEASHFLRNTGRKDVAIIDRHILKWLSEKGYTINKLTPRKYAEAENIFREFAKKYNMDLAKFDLYVWAKKTGKVLK